MDKQLTVCDVFAGCNFGKFTCCPGTNSTLLNEFALKECGIADLCTGNEEIWLLLLVFSMCVSFCWTVYEISKPRKHTQYTRMSSRDN